MGGYHDATGRYIATEIKKVPIPLTAFILAAGPLAAFSNGDSPTPGLAVDDSEIESIRWNNDDTSTAVFASVLLPDDRKPGTPITVKLFASKTGATEADAVTFAIGAFCPAIGAARNADATCGGTTAAMDGDATTTSTQGPFSVDIASADLPAAPAVLTISIKPTDGTLTVDDVSIHQVWIEYERNVTPT